MILKRLFITISFFFFAFTFVVNGQVTKQIILNVDTEKISRAAVKENCYFEGQNPGDDPGAFVTVAKVGDTLEWEGRPLNIDGEHTIWIKKIIRIGGPNIFDADEMENDDNKRGVRATIKKPTGRTKNKNIRYYRYKILFRIDSENEGPVYNLDPLIRSHN